MLPVGHVVSAQPRNAECGIGGSTLSRVGTERPTEIALRVNGTTCTLTYHDAEVLAEQLLSFDREKYMGDVNLLASSRGGNTDPGWLEGCESLSRKIEAVLTTAEPGPVEIDANGMEGDAVFHTLRLSGPVSWDATSDRHRLFVALEEARKMPPPSGLRAALRRLLGK